LEIGFVELRGQISVGSFGGIIHAATLRGCMCKSPYP
jgi:hypothetical protein